MLLKIEDLHTNYGAIHALKGISLEVNEGEIVCLIGSNGAGKTTLMKAALGLIRTLVNSIVGIVKSSSGTITFDGKDITHVPAHAMTKEGIGISPEGREVFPELTVEENLRIGAFVVKDENKIKESYERVYELFPRLKERITQQAGTLSGGEQQMLAVGRALMSNPKMILLDEPSLGLAPNFVEMIFGMIEKINKQGVTVLLIEQNANMALQVSQRAYVLENGLVSMSGKASDIANNPMVKKAYLGMA